ncbi:YpzG family protein [Halobacillus rhizosphaerae]
MGRKNYKPIADTFHKPHRSPKHLSNLVNGETEQTQSDQITQTQVKKRM